VPQYPSFPRGFPISVEQAVRLGRLGQAGSGWQAFLAARVSGAVYEAVHRALAEVEAGDIAKRQIGNLSGGQLSASCRLGPWSARLGF
jgi:zinc transport system ATP-binding protein